MMKKKPIMMIMNTCIPKSGKFGLVPVNNLAVQLVHEATKKELRKKILFYLRKAVVERRKR